MPKDKQLPKNESDKMEKLIECIDNLCFVIDSLKNAQNVENIQMLMNIHTSLKEIGNSYSNDGCLNKIHHELKILNKTIIMSALILSATKNPEKTLQEYHKIIEQYLN